MRNTHFARPARESGSTLLIAVVLLLLAGVMTVLAMNVGMFEQRSTANDVRAKAVHEVAEAGLAQGAEYLLRQNPGMLAFPSGTGTWTACTAADTSFPCGSVGTDLVDTDGDPATTTTVARRATMYRLTSSGASIANLDAALVSRMLPLTQTIATVGNGFPVAYGVAPVACFVANRVPGEVVTSPVRCATSASDASGRSIVTFVSVASMVGENARTTLTQSVGRYALLASPMGQPPIVASGSVDLKGGGQIVTNPNAGGTGVPVSVWTRKNVDKTGTPNTCYADEFFRFGAKNNDSPVFEGTNKTITCDTCQCVGNESLSYDASGNVKDEGIDILDVEGDSATPRTGQNGVNYNVRSDAKSYPTCEFPPDLFAHLFGIKTWADDDHDCFAERKIMDNYTTPSGVVVTMGADEVFLYENAVRIVGGTPANNALAKPAQLTGAAYPSAGLSGVVWCQSNCDTQPDAIIGSPDNPVVLVIDGTVSLKGRIFGIVFIRSTSGGATLTPATGYTMTSTEIANGGNADLTLNANTTIYGSLVVQGEFDKFNGTAAVIYSDTVLKAIGQNPNNSRFATLPGAWNDRSTY